MAEHQLPKLNMGVRFPSPAPNKRSLNAISRSDFFLYYKLIPSIYFLSKFINKEVFRPTELIGQSKCDKNTKFDKNYKNIFNFPIFTKR